MVVTGGTHVAEEVWRAFPRSSEVGAAVDVDRGAGEIGRPLRQEEGDELGHLPRAAGPAEGDRKSMAGGAVGVEGVGRRDAVAGGERGALVVVDRVQETGGHTVGPDSLRAIGLG